MNLAPLMDTFVALAAAVVSAAIPVITYKLNTVFKLNMDAKQRDALNTAIQNAVGKALSVGQAAGDAKLANVTIKSTSLAAAVSYVNSAAPDALSHFGLSDADVADKVAAQLALALHETGTAPASDPALAAHTAGMLDKMRVVVQAPHPPEPIASAVAPQPVAPIGHEFPIPPVPPVIA